MTSKQDIYNNYYQGAVTQTFYKGDEFYDIITWIMQNIDTKDVGKTGCQLTRKYSISIKRLSEDSANYNGKKRK